MDLSLADKTALVCGSTQGIGKAAAAELALLGASVILMARNEDSLKAALKELDASKGQKHGYICAEFSHAEDVKEKIEKYVFSNIIHILVNNTGGPPAGPVSAAKPE